MESEADALDRGINWWALFPIVFGAWWLLGELDVVTFEWGIVAPLAVITGGIAMLTGRWGPGCS